MEKAIGHLVHIRRIGAHWFQTWYYQVTIWAGEPYFMDRDRNLLFGILAVQLCRITPQQSAEAGALWVADPSRSLGDYLVESNALDDADRQFVDSVLNEAIEAAGGDARSVLESFGGEGQIHESVLGSLVFTESGRLCSTLPHLPLGHVRAPSNIMGVHERKDGTPKSANTAAAAWGACYWFTTNTWAVRSP